MTRLRLSSTTFLAASVIHVLVAQQRGGAAATRQLDETTTTTCPHYDVGFVTPTDQKGPFYLEGAVLDGPFAPSNELDETDNVLFVSGRVYGNDCKHMSDDVRVEIWYAGETGGYSVAGSELFYRGQMVTDECGYYTYMQTYPISYPERPILHVHFRVSDAETNDELLVTQMYFNGTVGTQSFSQSRQLQLVNVDSFSDGSRSVAFDIYLDVPGVTDIDDDNGVCEHPPVLPGRLSSDQPSDRPSTSSDQPSDRPTSAPVFTPSPNATDPSSSSSSLSLLFTGNASDVGSNSENTNGDASDVVVSDGDATDGDDTEGEKSAIVDESETSGVASSWGLVWMVTLGAASFSLGI